MCMKLDVPTALVTPPGDKKFRIVLQNMSRKKHEPQLLIDLVCFVFPREVPGELDPSSSHKLCVDMQDETSRKKQFSLLF